MQPIAETPDSKSYTREQKIERAQQAAQLLDNPVLVEALDETEFIRDSITSAKLDERESARAKVLALTVVRERLNNIISDGAMAAASGNRERI
jgi:hypothetical protein